MKGKNKIEEKIETKVEPIEEVKEKPKKIKRYIGYNERVIFFGVLFLALLITGMVLLTKILSTDNKTILNYQERGNIDYKVYLKPNDFYEKSYLDKNMIYIASLIKNINVNVNYEFLVEEDSKIGLSYEVIGRLAIYNESGDKVLYQKDYTLLSRKNVSKEQARNQKISQTLNIDYDYYNKLASTFKSTYGVDSNSDLTVYIKLYKNVPNIELVETSEMTLKVPLTQKTLNIQLNDQGINKIQGIVRDEGMKAADYVVVAIFVVVAIAFLVVLTKLVKLVMLLFPDSSRYDKKLKKILTEYDRLIVETPTTPEFENKKVVKIKKFEELLDVRDNLKKPIIYHNLIEHQKAYFYVEQFSTCYVFTLKAADINVEVKKDAKRV